MTISFKAALEPGLIDRLKSDHRFSSDEALGTAIRCTSAEVDELRRGGTPSYATALAIAAITGRDRLDFICRVTQAA
ncbi:XRE family transcriptional regulator [Rhodococcus rhodnii]|nr:XRE family transcriptional regulator [Rhodococcus rhodnii]TXG92613.1 XRE family transcriptional regulator [Rhodococcus rhodnii]